MLVVFPAIVAVYSADVVSGFVFPFETVGVLDEGGSRFFECKVIVHKNQVFVGADSARGARTVFRGDVVEVFESEDFVRLLLGDGSLVVITASRGCGCGSDLPRWFPFGRIVSN